MSIKITNKIGPGHRSSLDLIEADTMKDAFIGVALLAALAVCSLVFAGVAICKLGLLPW